ncbi:DNA-dependent protein kinase catalytic subunit [Lamellibrachia satsuma]|nr:DNA-dependent protein kinase catalytic subunit [Lamellibrachia satsuma]
MAANLQAQLATLHECLNQEAHIGPQNAHDIVGNLGLLCLQDVSDKEIDFCCSVLFHKDTGVVAFLRKTVSKEEFQAAKAGLLELLCAFITNHQRKAIPYAIDIKDACLSLLTRDKYSKVKLAVVPLLIELIHQTSGSNVTSELEVEKMVEKIFMELTKPVSVHSATVKAEIYHLLGVFAETYPSVMVTYSDRLLNVYVRTLKAEMTAKTKKPEFSVIAGCLQGLSCLLVHFTQSAEEGAKHAFDIFKYASMALDTNIKHSRFEMLKSALRLFARHAGQFSEYLLDDHKAMFEKFSYWSRHNNRDVCLAGTTAMETFLQQVSSALVSQAAQGSRDAAAFKFFIKEFRRIMDSPQSNSKEISLAIKGYGFFAAPCKIFLSVEDVKFMFNEMMQRSEQVFFGQTEVTDDTVFNLPSFLEALASILKELEEISETFLRSMERLVIMLMENFPKLSKKIHYRCFQAILKVLFALAPKGAVFRGFISRVVYQGLIRTCSHPIVAPTAADDEGGQDETYSPEGERQRISYRDYIILWKYLLESAKGKQLVHDGVGLEEPHALTEVIYDELIYAILRMVERLDLTATKAPADDMGDEGGGDSSALFTVSSDPMQGLEAAKPKDFVIFINLVDFCSDFLPDNQVQLFMRWVFTFGKEMITNSTRLPLVSGFYKLLAVCMKICTKIQYFNPDLSRQTKDEDSLDIGPAEMVDFKQRETCFLLFTKFSKEALTRMKQYKEDLLASCLYLILSLPHEVIVVEVAAVVEALHMAFRLGQSYLPMAGVALDALEDWSRSLPPHVLQPYFADLLPSLDAYLKSTGSSGTETDSVVLTSKNPGKKTGRRKIPIKLLKRQKPQDFQKTTDSQLEHIKLRCVRLLGSLGGAINNVLVNGDAETIGKKAVAWDTQEHLQFHVPFVDIKPTICFDPFLPRIVELATTSSDRQTKVAACELLHSIVLYMLGRSCQQPGEHTSTVSQMEPLYRKIFPVIMQLSCDVEQVAKQLFEPLMMQLIHWFTGSRKFESEDTMALLDTLMEGVVCATDTAFRDFSATCLKEFLKWSVKQASQKQLEKSPFNVKSLLKRIYSLARHPSSIKRLGAALTFNNIYVILREEASLVDVFTIEILVVFVESLALAHVDDKSLGTQEQCKLALGHIERIIQVKAQLFNKKSKLRRKPQTWEDETLAGIIEWLLRQCGRPETECRHKCMELVTSLVPCLPGTKTAKDFFRAKETSKNDANYFIDRFEGGMHITSGEETGLMKHHTMAQLGASFSVKKAVNWFDLVLASLDCYTWVFGQGLLSPAAMLANRKAVIFEVLNHFFEKLALGDVSDAAKLFEDYSGTEVFTPQEKDDYNRAKCTVIVRTMNFICVLLQPTIGKVMTKDSATEFWSESLWKTMAACVLEPLAVGFNMADLEVIGHLPNETLAVLRAVQRHLPDNVAAQFRKHLAESLATDRSHDLLGQLPVPLHQTSTNDISLTHLVCGYGQLHRAGLLTEALAQTACPATEQTLAEKLLQNVFMGISVTTDGKTTASNLNPVSQCLAEKLLELAFLLGVKAMTLLGLFMDKTPISGTGSQISHQGSLFYASFASVLNLHLVADATDFVPILAEYAPREPGIVGTVLSGILEQVATDRELRKKEGATVVRSVLRAWGHLRSWWQGGAATQDTKALVLAVLTKIIMIDSKVVCDSTEPVFRDVFNCYSSMLTDTATSLPFKSKVLDLIAFFTSVPEAEQKLLKKQLDRFVADNFPSKSSEYQVGTPRHLDYICALNKILNGLELSGSLLLLDLLISVLCTESQHVYEDEIQASLARFTQRLPKEQQQPALDMPFAIFTSTDHYTPSQRRAALERVCLSMLRVVHTSAVTEFFCDHITEVMTVIEARPPKSELPESLLLSHLCSFELMEVLYGRLSKNEVSSKESRVNQVFCQGHVEKGNELTTAITKAAHQVKSEDSRGENDTSGLRRQLRCAAYNTLVAVISCTQTDMKFFTAFLFTEKPEKGQFLLDNLVDAQRSYKFDVEIDAPLARKKKFVSIRKEARETEEGDSDTASVHYLASQYLADSSLSVDVSRTLLMNLRTCMQPPSHPWTATIERLHLCRRPTRRGTTAGIRRGSRPITRVPSGGCRQVSSVDKETGVNSANVIALTSTASGNGSYIVRSSSHLCAKFALINARSIRKQELLVRDYIDEHEPECQCAV